MNDRPFRLKDRALRCQECYDKAVRHLCRDCHAPLCDKHAYSRVDGNNRSITVNAPVLCRECYTKRYGKDAR